MISPIAQNTGLLSDGEIIKLMREANVTVEVGTETFEARATIVEGAERDKLYAKQAAIMPGFAEYQAKTTRKIPVVVLTRKQ